MGAPKGLHFAPLAMRALAEWAQTIDRKPVESGDALVAAVRDNVWDFALDPEEYLSDETVLALETAIRLMTQDLGRMIADGIIESRRRENKSRAVAPAPVQEPKPCVVYFIRAGENGPIKIGITTDVPSRLSSLQTSHAETLVVMTTTPGGTALEYELHKRFAHHRLRGEWFAPGDDLLAFIEERRAAP